MLRDISGCAQHGAVASQNGNQIRPGGQVLEFESPCTANSNCKVRLQENFNSPAFQPFFQGTGKLSDIFLFNVGNDADFFNFHPEKLLKRRGFVT